MMSPNQNPYYATDATAAAPASDEAWSDPSDELAEGTSYFDLLQICWHRKSLILLGLVVGLVIGAIVYSRSTPVYESKSDVLVVKKRPEMQDTDRMLVSYFEDYITTHTALIKSPLIVEQAVHLGDLGALPTFAGSHDIIQSIIGGLTADRGTKDFTAGSSNILTISFRCSQPDDCSVVIEAVLQSYREFLQVTYRNQSEDTITFITEARDILKTDLQELEDEYLKFREQSPLLGHGDQQVSPIQQRLALVEAQRAELLLRKAQLQSQLTTLERAEERHLGEVELVSLVQDLSATSGMERPLPGSSIDSSNGTEPYGGLGRELDQQVFQLEKEESRLLELFGQNHPHVQSVRRQLKLSRKFFAEQSGLNAPPSDSLQPLPNAMESYKAYLAQELERIDITDAALAELYDHADKGARKMTSYELKEEQFQRNIARSQQLYDGLLSQLQRASLVKDYGGFEARVIAPPRIGSKVKPLPTRVFTVAGLLGLMAGCGLVYLAELADTRFRSPDEIRRRLGLPVVGQVAEYMAADDEVQANHARHAKLDRKLCTVFAPRSTGSEAYRGVRTALYFSSQGRSHNVIQVTSPTPGDGKTTVISNLAVSIAQSGKRTLLIDADLRKARLHHIFNLSNTSGLGSVIGMDDPLDQAIQDTSIANLSVLPSGPLPPDPAELLTLAKFPELIRTVRERYEYVLIDTGPLLVVSDPCIVAPRVDGVLVVLNLTNNGRKEAQRSKEILASLDTNVLGVVVNGQGSQDPHGYGGYHYVDGHNEIYHDRNGNDCGSETKQKTHRTLLRWKKRS